MSLKAQGAPSSFPVPPKVPTKGEPVERQCRAPVPWAWLGVDKGRMPISQESLHPAAWPTVPTPPSNHTGLLLAEAQLLAVAGQGRLLSGTTNHHELVLKGPGQLQKIHLLVHTEVENLEIAKPIGQERCVTSSNTSWLSKEQARPRSALSCRQHLPTFLSVKYLPLSPLILWCGYG